MIDVETIVLEDGNKYTITTKVNDNSIDYVLLNNINDAEDFCIRKIINENGESFIVGLDSKEEFDRILEKISKGN